ncbi:MAG: S9 family peptidase [Alistipes sp.]|jgi:dipeptidyl-peptidase-4|nr:S9 family peptidase [Alistipes sp.]
MRKLFLFFLAAGAMATAAGQQLIPADKTPIYRHSFTARYNLTGEEPVREAALSPDSLRVGFVRDNDLFIKDIATGVETRVTHDGKRNSIINGATDWVYEEEYAFTRAWDFSPDGRQIAWLRFDESRVPEFTMMRYNGQLYPEPYTFKYPKAGEENSVVSLHIYDIASGKTRRIDTGANGHGESGDAPENDQYLPRIGWTPGGRLFFYRVNRLQNHFEVVLADDRSTRVIYEESSPAYVERPDAKTITFLPDGDRFIVRQETRTGWMHLYLHSIEHGFVGAITSGQWEVTALRGVEGDTVSYTSTELSPLSRTDFTIRLDGSGKRCAGTEQTGPPEGDPRQFISIPIEGGAALDAWMMTPVDFDPSRKYPVLMTQYSGPGSQSVSYAPLRTGDMMIYAPLLKAGYIVVCVDPRGTGGRGEAFKKCTYGDLGCIETLDQIAAARWLGALPYVDAKRIGIYGWSFGGFVALNSILKGADVFALAVAVAPVTNWRYYDTIYTEIYNGLPSDNPDGYDKNSPINYAELLRGKLLLVHGSGDDNVHPQNTLEMVRALVAAGCRFDMMIYPDDNHSMMPAGPFHIRRTISDYIIANL